MGKEHLCKHSYHADRAVVRLNVNSTRAAGVKPQTKCPTCIVTDDRVKLHSGSQSISSWVDLEPSLIKLLQMKSWHMRTDFSKPKAEQTATNTRVDASQQNQ
ncbi:hypothetical protein KQX54_000605 [Cotesia glomerata]|uniref:Uncharacterized protein n=1 Tax=Cotesia glomerata TaxID=32391 RepID=A0AAV7HXN3_COTGL|nr:hypothetical protein KQX54_000605 [Cotesia glomerata]